MYFESGSPEFMRFSGVSVVKYPDEVAYRDFGHGTGESHKTAHTLAILWAKDDANSHKEYFFFEFDSYNNNHKILKSLRVTD